MSGPEPHNYCPKCGVAYEPLQEYCLECGTRLPTNTGVVGVLASKWQRHFAWYPGDWIWPVLLFFALTVAATRSVTLPSAPAPTITTGPLPTAPGEPTSKTKTTRPNPNALAFWPDGKSGYTIILESLPVSSGRAAAVK